jgi:hypothetical protein
MSCWLQPGHVQQAASSGWSKGLPPSLRASSFEQQVHQLPIYDEAKVKMWLGNYHQQRNNIRDNGIAKQTEQFAIDGS